MPRVLQACFAAFTDVMVYKLSFLISKEVRVAKWSVFIVVVVYFSIFFI